MQLEDKVKQLESLVSTCKLTINALQKRDILNQFVSKETKLSYNFSLQDYVEEDKIPAEIIFLSLLAIGEGPIVFQKGKINPELIHQLIPIDHFYEPLGGLLGYYYTVICKIVQKNERHLGLQFSRPPGIDLRKDTPLGKRGVYAGLLSMPFLGEIYAIGGLGQRLGLKSETGGALPAATLQFLGRTLLEGLFRDLQAREYLYYKLFGKQVLTPVALMTSREENNHTHIEELLRHRNWFARPMETFFLFPQLSVPAITEEGHFSLRSENELTLHPGGHGALWRMAEEKGVFKWLQNQKRQAILIRQINNPLAGIDMGLLALIGIGRLEKKTLGIASCERLVNAAEGTLVNVERENDTVTLSNIEYTDFEEYGIEDKPHHEGYSLYPANTNIIYVDIEKIQSSIGENPLPGLMLNMKSDVSYIDENGSARLVKGGRLESMMQNISDSLMHKKGQPPRTFVTYNDRKKTISTTKRNLESEEKIAETPEGAFYDLMVTTHDLLKSCGVTLPEASNIHDYLVEGFPLIFIFHPALGPLYDVIRQKIKGGKFAKGAELQLEIAEVSIENLNLTGSLLIEAENVAGHMEGDHLVYSEAVGRCLLKDVIIENKGIKRPVSYPEWKNTPERLEAVKILLQGRSEFEATGVTIEGSANFVVPDGERWILSKEGLKKEKLEQQAWHFNYEWAADRLWVFRRTASHSIS